MQAVLYGPTGLPLNPQTGVIIDPTSAAMRMSIKPTEYYFPGGLGGHYRIGLPLTGGLTAIGAGGIILGFRWAPTTAGMLAIVKRISAIAGTRTTAGTTAFPLVFDSTKVTGYSVQHNAGGSLVALAASQKLRSSMGNSQASIYYANGSTVISGGTGTKDTLPFGVWQFDEQPAVTGVIRMGLPGDIYQEDMQAAHPAVFVANEGFYVQFTAAQGTSAVTDAFVTIEWVEALQY